MKVFRIAIAAFVAICVFIGMHSFRMAKMGKQISNLSTRITESARADNWQEVSTLLSETEAEWNKHKIWAALTINAADIEQLEISLKQAKEFAYLQQKSDFLGEYIMFSQLIEHISRKEGFHLEEIL